MAPKAKKKAAAKAVGEPSKEEEKKEEEPKKEEPVKEEPKPAVVEEKKPEVKEEPEKRKAEEKPAEEPAKKEAKTTEPTAKKETVKKEAVKPKKEEEDANEVEKDAPADKRPALKEQVGFNPSDTTLNVIPTMGGKVLMALTEGGMQYLIAGARANVGVKSGRYAFEVKIVEALNPAESSAGGARGRAPMPRQLVRLGFSTAGSSLVLGDHSEEHVFFDSEGSFCANKKKAPASQRFTRDQVITVVLNLDAGSPNANTVSLFREGERIAPPQAIPEELHGKTLYPHIAFRNVTVQVLMGPSPAKALSFKCRMLQSAAQEDVQIEAALKPKDGKFDVLLPVAFPDEGTFDWLDSFLAKNPHYVELSDRKILDWAALSGLWKPKASGWKTSNDKPEFNFGLPGMDDTSIRRVLNAVVPVVPRNYVVMEVKSNLIQSDRTEVLKRFASPHFKKTAHVVMGEPNEEFKQMQQEKMLQEKQEKSDAAWKAKKAEDERKKQIEQRQQQLAEMKKKADETRKKAQEEAKKKAEEAKKKAEKAKKVEARKKLVEEMQAKGEEPPPEEEEEEEVKDEDEAKEEDKMDVDEDKKDDAMDDEETEPPQVELTEEEKKMWFKPHTTGSTDLSTVVLNQSFGSFSIPEKSEGFEGVSFEWQGAEASKEYLRTWVLEKKRTSRIEDLQPSQWFQDKSKEWAKLFSDWQAKHKTLAGTAAQKAKEAAAKKAAEKKAAGAEGEEKGEEEAEEDEEQQADDVDIMMVEDINDVGNGDPLYKDFAFEDWALLQLRKELYLLQVAFKKDVDDPERPGVPEQHLAFYYNKYFRKQLTPKYFGVTTNMELTGLIKDTVTWNEEAKVLSTTQQEDLDSPEMFLKLTEENRRERQRRIDAGDETARLKFSPLAIQQPAAAKAVGAPAATVAGGSIRPAGPGGVRPVAAPKQWPAAGGKGAIYPQTGFRPPGASGGWMGAQWPRQF